MPLLAGQTARFHYTDFNRNTTVWSHYLRAKVPSLAASSSAHTIYRIAMLVHKCLNGRAPQYLIHDYSWADSRRSGDRLQAVKFWKLSKTTQPLVTGHRCCCTKWLEQSIPDSVRYSSLSENVFAKLLQSFLINRIRCLWYLIGA